MIIENQVIVETVHLVRRVGTVGLWELYAVRIVVNGVVGHVTVRKEYGEFLAMSHSPELLWAFELAGGLGDELRFEVDARAVTAVKQVIEAEATLGFIAEGHRPAVAEWLAASEPESRVGLPSCGCTPAGPCERAPRCDFCLGAKGQAAEMKVERSLLFKLLAPLVAIADAYDKNDLDECRPERGKDDTETELFNSRGGRSLLRLRHVLEAREVVRKL